MDQAVNHLQVLKTLIVVEDEHLVAEGIAGSLRELDLEVLELCPNGERAIEFCRTAQPDMAIMDIRMPGMNGLEAAAILFDEMQIPVVVVSAYSDPEYTSTSANVGVFGYLLKPVTRDNLRATLAVAWGQFLSHQQSTSEVDRLNKRIEDRKFIEKAKWVLVYRLGISEGQAMRRLQKQARDNRRTLIDVSMSILENQELFTAEETK